MRTKRYKVYYERLTLMTLISLNLLIYNSTFAAQENKHLQAANFLKRIYFYQEQLFIANC